MIILKNDVIAILSEKVNSISARNGQSTFPVGPDKQYEVVDLSPQWLTIRRINRNKAPFLPRDL